MKKLILCFVVIAASVALAEGEWSANYKDPKVAQWTLDPNCTKDCAVVVTYVVQPGKEGVTPMQWAERIKLTKLDTEALIKSACVDDDGPRPSGFKQAMKRCETAKEKH